LCVRSRKRVRLLHTGFLFTNFRKASITKGHKWRYSIYHFWNIGNWWVQISFYILSTENFKTIFRCYLFLTIQDTLDSSQNGDLIQIIEMLLQNWCRLVDAKKPNAVITLKSRSTLTRCQLELLLLFYLKAS
jgi:hypothetical protein